MSEQTLLTVQALCYVFVAMMAMAVTVVVSVKCLMPLVTKLRAVEIDGSLYVLIGMFGAVNIVFTSDDAYKYVNPYLIFWIKAVVDISLAGVSSLKMFRSTTYADHVAAKENSQSAVARDAMADKSNQPAAPAQPVRIGA